MADRRTKIILDLDEGPYKRGLAQASAATKAFTKSLDTSNERMSWLVQSSLALGPALMPIGASIVPAVAGLSTGLAAAAGAAGATALAFQGVGEGLEAANEYAIEPSAKNLEALRVALDNLGPAGQQFVLFLDDLRPKMRELRETAQAGLFPGLMDGIDDLMTRAPQVERIIYNLTNTVGDLVAEAGQGLSSARWDDFFDYMETEARPILTTLGRSFGNVTEALANMLMGFDPLTDQFAGGLLEISRDFAAWSRGLDENQGFQNFVGYVERVGPKVVDTLGTLVVAIADIAKAAAPVGEASLPIIESLARALAAVAESPAGPALIGAAAGVSALSRAIALSNVAGTTALLAGFRNARAEGGRLGKAADKLAGQFSKGGAVTSAVGVMALSFSDLDDKMGLANIAMGAMVGSFAGPWGAAIGGGIGLVKDLAEANDGLEDAIADVNRAAKDPHDLRTWFNAIADAEQELAKRRKQITKETGADKGVFGSWGDDPTGLKDLFKDGTWLPEAWDKLTGGTERAADGLSKVDRKALAFRQTLSELRGYVMAEGGDTFKHMTTDLGKLQKFSASAAPALDKAGISIRDLQKSPDPELWGRAVRAIRNYNKTQDGVPARSAKVRQAIRELDNPLISAADSADQLEAALSGLFDPAINEEEAMIAYRRGVIDLRKQLNRTNGTLNEFTEAGLANREMIAKQVTNTTKWAVAQAAQDGNSKRAIRTLKNAREMLIRVGTASGMSRKQIENYLKELNFTKGTWRAKVEAAGAGKAKNLVKDFNDALDNLPFFKDTKVGAPGADKARRDVIDFDKVVDALNPFHDTKVDAPGADKSRRDLEALDKSEKNLANKHDVRTKAPGAKQAADDIDKVAKRIASLPKRFVSNLFLDANAKDTIADVSKIFDKLNPFNADGRIWDFYAGGGVRENHIAQIAPAGAMRVWAEPETEGEAYIPFARSKRTRSRAIADETVDRLGGRVLWNRDGAAYTNVSAPTAMPVSLSSEHARIESMYADIVTEFGRGLGDAVEFALSQMPSGFSWPLPRQYQPSGTWGTYASGGSHPALDWPAPNGTPIYPVMPGRVLHTTSLGSSYGNYTEIDHGQGLSSLYAHQLGFRTRAGETVFPGQTIGLVDSTGNSTGPHLHLELQRNGTSFDYTSMLTGGGASMGIYGIAGQYHGDHSGLDRASPSVAQSYAHSVMGRWGWSEFMWPYWLDLGNRESGWRWNARNPSSGAYGIPQSLPPEKLAAAGPDWQTNAGTQIDWMGNYIAERYGSPYKAIGWHNANNWYGDGGIQLFDTGGVWRHGQLGINLSGRDEYVNDPQATAAAIRMADGGIVDELARMLGGFNYGPGVRPPRRPRQPDTPDITRRAQRQLMRAERHLSRTTELFARRSQEEKAAKRRVDRAQKALDDAKGKVEKKEAKAALDDAKSNLELARDRADRVEKQRSRAEKDLDQAQQDVRDARADQKVLDKAVRRFGLGENMGRSEVRAEFNELLAGVREAMGKDSLLYRALKQMADRATQTAKRLDQERKEREKLTERLRNLRQASNQYESTVRSNFRNDPFTGGLDEFALQVRADRNDSKSMKAALNRARRKGLSGGLFSQLAASGNLELAQQFGRLDRAEIRRYERLFEQRQKTSAALGERAADIVYGKRLDRATRATERQARVIERLQRKLDRIEDRVGNRIEAGARRGVRDGMNGRKKKLHQFVMEARS